VRVVEAYDNDVKKGSNNAKVIRIALTAVLNLEDPPVGQFMDSDGFRDILHGLYVFFLFCNRFKFIKIPSQRGRAGGVKVTRDMTGIRLKAPLKGVGDLWIGPVTGRVPLLGRCGHFEEMLQAET
jgi:hypothetical protein